MTAVTILNSEQPEHVQRGVPIVVEFIMRTNPFATLLISMVTANVAIGSQIYRPVIRLSDLYKTTHGFKNEDNIVDGARINGVTCKSVNVMGRMHITCKSEKSEMSKLDDRITSSTTAPLAVDNDNTSPKDQEEIRCGGLAKCKTYVFND